MVRYKSVPSQVPNQNEKNKLFVMNIELWIYSWVQNIINEVNRKD